VQDRKQRRVHDEGLGVPDELADETPRRRGSRKRLSFLTRVGATRKDGAPPHRGTGARRTSERRARKSARALHATELLEERERDDLRVREPLERLVASSVRIEQRVGVVDEAEEDGQGLFREGGPWGMVGTGHLLLLGEERLRWPSFYLLPNPRNTHLGDSRHRNPGAKERALLSAEQQEELREALTKPPLDGGMWNSRKVGEWIERRTGRVVSRRSRGAGSI
jgi:hypothetical protein